MSRIDLSHIDLTRAFPMRRPSLPGGRCLIAAAILIILLAAFAACGVFTQTPGPEPRASYGAALFFSVNIAYIVPIFGYISERTMSAISALSPVLDAEPNAVDAWRRRVCRKSGRWFASVLAVALVSGVAHNLLLYPSATALWTQMTSSAAVASVVTGTLLIWLVLTTVIAALLDNALLLNRLARRARIPPFHTRSLRPFASVAVFSTLGIIGAQATFPIMSVESSLDPLAYIPGLLATGIPLLLLAALPVWPLHRRLRNQKRHMLAEVDGQLAALPLPDPARPESLEVLMPLLAYRRELAQAPEWPFDLGVLTRLALYLIIPPLTWVGAALIENVVEAFL